MRTVNARGLPGVEPTNPSARELALRLADVHALVESAQDADAPDELADVQGGFLSALEHALRGEAGCIEPDEWQAQREQALADYGEYLGIEI